MSSAIVSTPETLAGKPRVAVTRISVAQILEELAAGETPAEIVETYPALTLEGVQAAIAFAIEQVHAARYAVAAGDTAADLWTRSRALFAGAEGVDLEAALRAADRPAPNFNDGA